MASNFISNFIFTMQGALLSRLPRGDDPWSTAVYSGLSALIVGGVGLATSPSSIAFLHRHCLALIAYFRARPPASEKHHTLYIPEYVENGSTSYNPYYTSAGWYLTHVHQCCSGALRATYTVNGLFLIPEVNHAVSINFEDQEMSCVYETKITDKSDDKKMSFNGIRLGYTGADGRVLVRFITKAQELRQEETAKTKWAQRIHYVNHNPEAFWDQIGKLTHNKKTWDTVVLDNAVKNRLVNDIDTFMRSEEWYQRMGVSWSRGLLLYGQPGCGKTSIIKAISYVHKLSLYYLALNEVHSDADLRRLFESIPERAVLVLEDVDAMGKNIVRPRSETEQEDDDKKNSDAKDEDKPWMQRGVTLSSLLNLMDGVTGAHGRITIMTTNHPEKIDSALLRAGRCDLKIKVGLCDEDGIRQLYKLYFDADISEADLERIGHLGLTPADVTSVFLTTRAVPDIAIEMLYNIAKERTPEANKEDFMICNIKNCSHITNVK